MTEVERIAKMIVGALYGPVDPDGAVVAGELQRIAGFLILPPPSHTMPLWRVFEPAAIAIVEDMERQKEMAEERGRAAIPWRP